MMSIASRIKEREKASNDLKDFEKGVIERREILRRELIEKCESVSLELNGLDSDRVERAMRVISIQGSYAMGGADRESARAAAVKCLAQEGGKALRSEYFGTKSYDRWVGQRSDHAYGMCPSHGYIIFAIGLRVRDRDLTPEEIDDALYYLENMKKIEEFKETGEVVS